MDTYTITTKDGITITDIPGDVPKDAPELKARVAALRSGRSGSTPVSEPYGAAPAPASPAAAATLGAAPAGPSAPGVPASAAADEPTMANVRSVDQFRPPLMAEPGQTTAAGLLGAAVRGSSPVAAGTALGAAAGAPFAGVGAAPGALAGAGITAATFAAGDMAVPVINSILGTRYQTPTEAWGHLLTQLGVPEPDTAAERIVEAASRGAAAGIGDVGAGLSLAKSGSKTLQGIGQAMAAGPAGQVAGGGMAAAAAQGAGESGLGPGAQIGAGILGGVVGSRLAPGDVSLTRPQAPRVQAAEDAAAEIGTLIKKASTARPGRAAARQKLVALADINPEAKAAAGRLGIELPADVFSDNPQVRAAAGLTRSLAGSETEAAWRASVANALDQADDVMKQYDATFIEGTAAPAVVSNRVRDVLTKTREGLSKQATDLYAEVEQAVPKQTPVKLDKLRATLDEIASEVGEGGLSSQEKALRKMLEENPTYGRLLREKNLIGQALSRKESPYGNMEAGSLKRLYGALAEDQLANVDEIGRSGVYFGAGQSAPVRPGGLGEQLRSANLIYAKERDLGERIIEVFGSDVEGSIANKMRSSIVSAGKGSGEQFNKLLDLVPEDLRRETVATSLASVARNRRGEFGFAEYAQTYKGLRANPEVYSKIVKTLGDGSDQVLRDLYEVSKRITDARANVLVTGKANQALLQKMTAENLIFKVFGTLVVRSGAAAAGSAMFGPAGAGAASMVTSALSSGDRNALQKAARMFVSPQFQNLVVKAAAGEAPGLDQIRAVARSSAFDQFARAVKLPIATDQRELWILAALQSGAGVEGDEQK